jgi:hypothetical protein
MKNLHIKLATLCCTTLLAACSIGGLKLQEDYDYIKSGALDPNIKKTALQYLMQRGKAPVTANDTVFKYMQLGLEYAGIDQSEYEKSGRTFIFFSNSAIRVLPTKTTNGVVTTTSNVPTGGLWFDFPIMEKNADGSQKYATDGTPVSHPAKSWNEYSKETVRNYFMYFIIQADYGFNNATTTNTTMQTLLPAGTVAGKESRLGYMVTSAAANGTNTNAAGNRVPIFDYANGGAGFDPEGKINMKIVNSDYSPLMVNNFANVATAGLVATNGQIHVCSTTTYPSRY